MPRSNLVPIRIAQAAPEEQSQFEGLNDYVSCPDPTMEQHQLRPGLRFEAPCFVGYGWRRILHTFVSAQT